MRLLAFCAAVLVSVTGPVAADSRDFRFYQIDLFPPTKAMVAEPNAVLAKRMPELPALARMYQFGPSTGILTVDAAPANHAKIERLVAAFNARPQIAIQYAVMRQGRRLYGGTAIVRDGDDYLPESHSTTEVGGTVVSGYIVRANATLRDGSIATRLVAWSKPGDGSENTLDRVVPLKPASETEVGLTGPDRLSLKVVADVVRRR